jgi:hypothetical protein
VFFILSCFRIPLVSYLKQYLRTQCTIIFRSTWTISTLSFKFLLHPLTFNHSLIKLVSNNSIHFTNTNNSFIECIFVYWW